MNADRPAMGPYRAFFYSNEAASRLMFMFVPAISKRSSGFTTARGEFELMPMGIHWPEIDEDLGIAGMPRGRPVANY